VWSFALSPFNTIDCTCPIFMAYVPYKGVWSFALAPFNTNNTECICPIYVEHATLNSFQGGLTAGG
jgi:hypothetical protein